MGNKKEQKTNVMRLLEQANIPFATHDYTNTDAVSGQEVAAVLKQNPQQVYKTLVTVGKSGAHFVFVIPVNTELDLKKAARAVGEKAVEMIKTKELLPLTGYIHGGCSPIGMKKQLVTVFSQCVQQHQAIIFSGGKIGFQVEVKPSDLQRFIAYTMADLVVSIGE